MGLSFAQTAKNLKKKKKGKKPPPKPAPLFLVKGRTARGAGSCRGWMGCGEQCPEQLKRSPLCSCLKPLNYLSGELKGKYLALGDFYRISSQGATTALGGTFNITIVAMGKVVVAAR